MTLYEFNQLTEEDKLSTVWELGEYKIDLSRFSGGVYLLVAESENRKTVKRIIVEK